MSVRFIVGEEGVAMYDSETDWAFGPVLSSRDDAEAFVDWLPVDVRVYTDAGLEAKYVEWAESRKKAAA